MGPLFLGGKSAPKTSIHKWPHASSWHSQTIFYPILNCFTLLTRLLSSYSTKWDVAPLQKKPMYGVTSWARLKHTSLQDAERMGTLCYMFILLLVNSSLLQVMLSGVCFMLPSSFLLDTWVFFILILMDNIKFPKLQWLLMITGSLKCFFFPCHSWLNLIELIEFRWGVVQGSHDAHVSTQIIVLKNLNFYMVNQW